MKKLIIIPFIFLSIIINATNYYVAPDGNDAAAGGIDTPWKTWGFAFNSTNVQPGDCVLFRGGVYNKNMADGLSWYYYPNRNQSSADGGTGYAITRDGTAENWIIYSAYMPDFNAGNKPILNCRSVDAYNPLNRFNFGIRAINVDYVKFYGLTVRGVIQNPAFPGDASGYNSAVSYGWRIYGNPFIIERCIVHDTHGIGLEVAGATAPAFNYIINTDVYNCCDSITGTLPGNDGYGFDHSGGGQVYYLDCRAWLCGDYGFWAWTSSSSHAAQYTVYDGCWGFRNGMLSGTGQGFTAGWIAYTDGNIKRTYKNCIAAFNRGCGWFTYDYKNTYPNAVYMNIYNSVGYHNGYQGVLGSPYGYFANLNPTWDTEANELKRVLRNNISFDNQNGNVFTKSGGGTGGPGVNAIGKYTHTNNTWDIPLTITSADFVSLDSTGISGARQADGSLPDLGGFLKIKVGSSLIGAGIGVGVLYDAEGNYHNDPPDLGPYAYDGALPEPPFLPEISTTLTYYNSAKANVSGTLIDDGTNGENAAVISATGFVWSTTANPTLSNNIVPNPLRAEGTFTGVIQNLPKGTTFHVRSFATNQAGTSYGADIEFTTPAIGMIQSGGKKLYFNGKQIIY